ncbi:MAG: antibiotic biosynthesis monooxygenase [Pseudomonadaceae bacterium]|nr:antibiotic biosynthesis monooxygenase [Pseudomonadaceae bacterium]
MSAQSVSDTFVVIVEFKCMPSELEASLALLRRYIGSFLNTHAGFIESFLQHDSDGNIVHVARWQSESDFRAFAVAAQTHPDLPELRKLAPSARFFQYSDHFLPTATMS